MRISYIEMGVKFRLDREVVFVLKDNLFSFIIHKINQQSVIVETSAYGIYKSLIALARKYTSKEVTKHD